MEICLTNIAIRFVKYTTTNNYAVFELGRVSHIELEALEKAYTMHPLAPVYGDPTNGIIQKSEAYARLYTVRLCLFIKDIREGKGLIEKVYDNSNVTISYTSTNVRPTLRSIEHRPNPSRRSWFGRYPVDWDRCVEEAESEEKEEIETSTSFEVLAVAACNRGSSCLQIARMDGNERRRFDDFADEYGSELNGQFDELLTDKSLWHEHDRVLKNVSFADDLVEFKPGESICLSYIKIERTGDRFKVVEARRHAGDDVGERWHLAPAKQPKESLKRKFMYVAVRNVKKASYYDYYILEIGRLTHGELSDLKEIFRYTTHSNDDIVNDETNGEVVSKEVPITGPTGANLPGYHTAKICVYWPGCPLKVGTSDDAVAITLESHDGNYRPTVKDINSMNDVVNELSKNWFERFPFEARDDTPIKIRLNGVFATTVTHAREYGGESWTIEFSLIQCMNYRQAVEDIGRALAIREGEPGRGISWDPHTKILTVKIQNENSDDISRIADARSHLRMLDLQYNPDNGAWGINMMYEFPYHGGFVYANPSRRSGKTAELKRQLNAAYGPHSIPEGYMDTDIAGDAMRYCMHDVAIQESMWRRAQQKKSEEEETMRFGVPKIKQLIFDDPATVVIWEDDTKTIVHARDEKFDPEKGLAMAIARKALGNGREYYTYMQRQIKKGLRDSEGRKKKDEAKPAKKPKTAPKKKGGKK